MVRALRYLAGTSLICVSAATGSLQAQSAPAASPDFFESKIRPILANNCYGCHTNSAMGGLRLDSSEALMKGGKRGAAVVPGDPDNSVLIKAVLYTDPNLKMPMGSKLKQGEIDDLKAWVKAGAVWPKAIATPANPAGGYTITKEHRQFWSFRPLKTPAVPAPKDARWAKTDIDRFVLARLEQEGLKPVRPASKRDLLRRVTLDVTGLLPTPEEYAAFESDRSPDAYAKVVDRLLASPHYGERWGRIWLDVARYGEDDYRSLNPNPRGYRPYPNAWAYRDWVVQAFNDDLPYDKFVKAQLAGDLMGSGERHKMLPATGFLGLGPWYYDNGSNEITRADERHDRVDAVTRGFLGLTVACARCHDHKYDPVPQADYYALAGVFYNTTYEEYPQAPKKVVEEFLRLEEDLDNKQKILQETTQNLSSELSRALALQTANYLQGVWEVTGKQKKEMAQVVETRKLDYELLDRWIKYMARPTDKYKNKEAWQAMMTKGGGSPDQAKKLAEKFQDEIIAVMLAKNVIDEENKVIYAKDIEGTKPKKRTDKPSNFVSNKDFNPGSWLQLKSLAEDDTAFWTEIFQRELRDSDDPNAMMAMGMRMGKPGVLLFRSWGLESRLGPEAQARLKVLQADVEGTKKKLDPHYPFLHGVKDADKPVDIPLALRGNPETLGKEVPRHFLSVFSPDSPAPFSTGSGRLELADLIVKQPIAMRVMVNRVWKAHFGTGIVDTPSNFGSGGERPTNPELLEYLASEFVKNGMSVKKLQREMLLSAVYQLGTEKEAAAFEKDSGNRWYWRANRKRMDAEQIRDSILQVAGDLEDAVGGPSEDLTPKFKRRTLYGKVSRYKLDAYLQLFDFPTPNISAEKRFTTTVPLQRLFMMNSDFVQLESEALIRKIMPEPGNPARIRKLYSKIYGRLPNEAEVQTGLEYLRTEPLKEYEEQKRKASEEEKEGKPRRSKPADADAAEPPATISEAAKPAPAENTLDSTPMPEATGAGAVTMPEANAGVGMGMGMMGGMQGMQGMGMMGRGGQGTAPVEVKYSPTTWGRYAKVLLSSTEFLFIN